MIGRPMWLRSCRRNFGGARCVRVCGAALLPRACPAGAHLADAALQHERVDLLAQRVQRARIARHCRVAREPV